MARTIRNMKAKGSMGCARQLGVLVISLPLIVKKSGLAQDGKTHCNSGTAGFMQRKERTRREDHKNIGISWVG